MQKKSNFPATLASIIFSSRSLNKFILEDSNRPNRIVHINEINVIYSVIFFKIFDVKVVFAFYTKEYIYILR